VLRDFRPGKPKMGTVFVQGTKPTDNLLSVVPELDRAGINVKIVAAISPQLFRLQDSDYRERVAGAADRWDAMLVTNRARRVSVDWIENSIVAEYSLTSDWDDRWRTGGTVDEVIAEAHLSAEHILSGIERFARERERRLSALRAALEAVEGRA